MSRLEYTGKAAGGIIVILGALSLDASPMWASMGTIGIGAAIIGSTEGIKYLFQKRRKK